MKPSILNLLKKAVASLAPFQNLVLISLAAWAMHILLRVMLLFRSNPYGFPFVSKPDWFIFHAVCLDFLWIVNALVIFAVIGFGKGGDDILHVSQYTEGLGSTFNISLWTLLVPVLTAVLIARRLPSLIVLFLSSLMAGVTALILQPHILVQIAADESLPSVTIPAFFIHGDSDRFVPVSDSIERFEIIGSDIKDIVIVEGASHAEAFIAGSKEIRPRLSEFINKIYLQEK